MTLDKSLKVRAGMIRNRNVLTRAERIGKLQEDELWREGDKVLGLPKTRVVKISLKKKKKAKKAEEGEAGAAGATPGAAPAAAPAAKGGKAAGKAGK